MNDILPHMLNYLHILSHVCVNRPIWQVFYGQSLLFNVSVFTPMPAAPLGPLPCTGTRACLPVVMHQGTSQIFHEQFLRHLELLLHVAQYLAFMEWLDGQQGRLWSFL
jgi:hypothetical protein